MFGSPFKDGVVVLLILLLFFGAKRLPELSRALGSSVKEFKGGLAEGAKPDAEKPEISSASGESATSAPQEPVSTGSQSSSS